jgi:hypothetical protein
MRDIRERKGLESKEHNLDHMGSTKLAANLFRGLTAMRQNRMRSRFLLSRRTELDFAFGRQSPRLHRRPGADTD